MGRGRGSRRKIEIRMGEGEVREESKKRIECMIWIIWIKKLIPFNTFDRALFTALGSYLLLYLLYSQA